jgi:hypothetical protein
MGVCIASEFSARINSRVLEPLKEAAALAFPANAAEHEREVQRRRRDIISNRGLPRAKTAEEKVAKTARVEEILLSEFGPGFEQLLPRAMQEERIKYVNERLAQMKIGVNDLDKFPYGWESFKKAISAYKICPLPDIRNGLSVVKAIKIGWPLHAQKARAQARLALKISDLDLSLLEFDMCTRNTLMSIFTAYFGTEGIECTDESEKPLWWDALDLGPEEEFVFPLHIGINRHARIAQELSTFLADVVNSAAGWEVVCTRLAPGESGPEISIRNIHAADVQDAILAAVEDRVAPFVIRQCRQQLRQAAASGSAPADTPGAPQIG